MKCALLVCVLLVKFPKIHGSHIFDIYENMVFSMTSFNDDLADKYKDDNLKLLQDMVKWTPEFSPDDAELLSLSKDVSKMKDFIKFLVTSWQKLFVRVKDEVLTGKGKSSITHVANPFVVSSEVSPEFNYWNNYWIVKGLLLSGMSDEARLIIENLINSVKKYGYIPAGNREYYLKRSNPPMLVLAVDEFYKKNVCKPWLIRYIDVLAEDLNFWLKERTITFEVDDELHTLCRYDSTSSVPRGEHYKADLEAGKLFKSEEEKAICYREINSASESGWGYSSRWMYRNNEFLNKSYTEVSSIIPVELNAFLCRSFKILGDFYIHLDQKGKDQIWLKRHEQWKKSIQAAHWNKTEMMWFDYDLRTMEHVRQFYPTNLAPLWADVGIYPDTEEFKNRLIKYLEGHVGNYPGGVPATLKNSGELWDFPNAWPPMQAFVVQAIHQLQNHTAETLEVAFLFARRWVLSVKKSYDEENKVYEKYDVRCVGRKGTGIDTHWGFGWTIGVTLEFIDFYQLKPDKFLEEPKKRPGMKTDTFEGC